MAPHGSNLPAAATESARAARKNFFCELCQKGYARMNEYEAHEGSYDHQHRKRLKEMKHLTNSAQLSSSRSRSESSELQSISLSSAAAGKPKKKPVFKAVGASSAAATVPTVGGLDPTDPRSATEANDPSGAVRNGWWSERYMPGIVSGCGDECGACGGEGEGGRRIQL